MDQRHVAEDIDKRVERVGIAYVAVFVKTAIIATPQPLTTSPCSLSLRSGILSL